MCICMCGQRRVLCVCVWGGGGRIGELKPMRDSANKMNTIILCKTPDHAIRTMDTVHPTQSPHLRNAFSVRLCLLLHRFVWLSQRCTLLVHLYIHVLCVCVCVWGGGGGGGG